MSISTALRTVCLLSCAPLAFAMGPASAQSSQMYSNCQYRFAVIFPGEPATRDVSYTAPSGATVPARQFYLEQGPDRYSVTVADFSSGPAVDDAIVEHAAAGLRQRGEVRFQATAPYDPGMPGRQLNIFQPNGRQLRASVYMADHRLTVTEADATPGEFAALQFEQSITLIDEKGEDLDRPNGGAEARVFPCR